MAMKLLILEAVISAVYVFDASTSPILHISLLYLTILYLVSLLEITGVLKFLTYLVRRTKSSGVGSEHGGTATAFWSTY
ncbi:MAG: hypothetical protein OK456_01630 [Thaumarchaeota archaeon]|nr:hypothetical protein [Nitrososphaerota archaeon]